jgi:hypothetical protein
MFLSSINELCVIDKYKTMTETLRRILITVNSLAFGGAILWTVFKFDYEPLVTALVLLATLIGLWVSNPKEENLPIAPIQNEKPTKNIQKNEIHITNNVGDVGKTTDNLTPLSASSTKEELEIRKKITNILFVDDDTKFKIIKILNVAGWVNTKIVKDVENPDSDIVTKAHILFIDINGVGLKMQFKDEGLGLANYLKKKYPEKKIIIYSTEPNGDRFHEAFRKVDDFLYKNADPIEFQEIIEQFSAEINLK